MNKLRFRQGRPWDAIVTDGRTVGGGYSSEEELTEAYGGRLVCESVDPEFKALLLAAPDPLAACEIGLERLVQLGEHGIPVGGEVLSGLETAIAKARDGR